MNMRFPYLVAVIAASATVAIAQTSTWVPDKAHSEVDFSVVHLGLAKVHGHFGNIGGAAPVGISWVEDPGFGRDALAADPGNEVGERHRTVRRVVSAPYGEIRQI